MKNNFFHLVLMNLIFALFILAMVNFSKIDLVDQNANNRHIDLKNFKLNFLPKKSESFQNLELSAKSAIIVDVFSGAILYKYNEDQKLPVASTTKIATALVVLEDYGDRLEDVVTVTPQMINVEPSKIYLQAGEKITVRNLLYGLLIESGNDCAYALANHFGPLENFVFQMNKKVETLGLKNTKFFDPAGLKDEGYSTASDLAYLGTYALRNPLFSEIVSNSNAEIFSIDKKIRHQLTTSNRLLLSDEPTYLPYVNGVKTGFTYAAGHVLVSSANLNNHPIVCVVLGTDKDNIRASAEQSFKMITWAYNNYSW